MRFLRGTEAPESGDFREFFHVAFAKAGAPALVVCGSLILSHDGTKPQRKESKQTGLYKQAPRKPAGDLLVLGNAYANPAEYGQSQAVRIAVEIPERRWRKELAVFGDRVWLPGITGAAPSEPRPFTSIPVDYAHAFGGQGFAWNPVGMGTGPGDRGKMLPNIEFVDRPITSPSSVPGPASFAPIDALWRPRADRVGTYGGKWLAEYWPGVPPDFDPAYWNEAPGDQQFPNGFQGNETIIVHNMHATNKHFQLKLPALRCRAFIQKLDDSVVELPMMLDTLAVNMEAGKTELVWRGAAAVQSAKLRDVKFLFTLLEPLSTPMAHADCLALFAAKRRAKYPTPAERKADAAAKAAEEAAKEAKKTREVAEKLAGIFADLQVKVPTAKGLVVDPDKWEQLLLTKMPATPDSSVWTRARVIETHAKGGMMDGANLAGLDLTDLDLQGAKLTGANLAGTWLQRAKLGGAQLTGVNAENANFSGADLTDAALYNGFFRGVFFIDTKLDGVDFSGLNLDGVNFERAAGEGLRFRKAQLKAANFRGAKLPKAQFAGADVSRAQFDDAQLVKADFGKAIGHRATFLRADLTNARASEADFRGAKFAGCKAVKSNWQKALLDVADFSRADLTKGYFSGADLPGANFDRALVENGSFDEAVMHRTIATNAKFVRTSFQRADLLDANFSGSMLYKAGFMRANLKGTKLEGAMIDGTILAL